MKRPPYTRALIERSKLPANANRTFWLLIGTDAWEKATQFDSNPARLFTLCPPGESPRQFDWSVYASAPPPIGLIRCGEVDGQQLQVLVQIVLSVGSPRIYDMFGDAVYQPRRSAA